MDLSLLIIDKHQFGYLTDVYEWCKYLRKNYKVTVLSADVGEEKIDLSEIKVDLVNFKVPKPIRIFTFLWKAFWYISSFKGIIIIEYFQGCSILKRLFPKKKMLLDIRTLSVSPDTKHRNRYNNQLIKDCKYFEQISAISEGVIRQIGLKNIHLLPLGANCISSAKKIYSDGLRLLYVGTFQWRNIEQTLYGIKLFVEKYPYISISYDLVGTGEIGQVENLKLLAQELDIDEFVTFHGAVPYTKLTPFFDKANIGISYIPITSYYDHQPPTKTFEYILSGLFCVATETSENVKLITAANGILIKDTPESFMAGLEIYLKQMNSIEECKIRDSLSYGTWESIIHNRLLPILKDFA